MISRILKCTIFLLILVTAFSQSSLAQTSPNAKIGVVDMQKIMREIDVAQDIDAQMAAYEEEVNAELTAAEQKLKDEKTQIERQKTLVTPDAYSKKQADFNRKAAAFRVNVQERNRQLQRSRIKALDKVKEQMIPIVRAVMDEYGATLVVDVSEILFAEKPLEMTEAVISRLNKELEKTKVELVPLKKS
ncbi:OmpH family outer membrane protein [uncultured Sneathiella sp.]|uniref:OmpH family outer membrane protein n=1 Tax=uncultured Sneathiella sp. TaxID=879315 RepID=UPI0030EECB4E|tara:strand:- start:22113 stop:22679 length:567 start_codon:yes stop_codon:yes gene_type:complete